MLATARRRTDVGVVQASKCLLRGSRKQIPAPPGQTLDPTRLRLTDSRACDPPLALHRWQRRLDSHWPSGCAQPTHASLQEHIPAFFAGPWWDDRRAADGL